MRDLLLSLGDFLDVLHDGALVVDRHGTIVVANRAIGALFGYNAQALVGGPLAVLIPRAHRVRHDRQVREFLDHGKSTPINDRHGHAAGDELLRVIGRRLRHAVREADTAARPGGDEFVLLFAGLDEAAAIEARVAALAAQIAEPVHLAGGRLLQVDADLGAATWPRDGATPEALLAHADAGMYAGKRARRPDRPGS